METINITNLSVLQIDMAITNIESRFRHPEGFVDLMKMSDSRESFPVWRVLRERRRLVMRAIKQENKS